MTPIICAGITTYKGIKETRAKLGEWIAISGVGGLGQTSKRGTPTNLEEFFGPVALFFHVANEDEAIALANDSKFGLGGFAFTADIERGNRVASRIETGMIFVNHPTWTAPELPFGGVKHSGYARELSSLGIQQFVNKKLVCVVLINAPA